MDTYRLKVFLECARLKNFSRAAGALRLSQPSISLHVRGLEEWCGMRLFERRGRRVELTDAGETLKEHAQRILASFDTALHDVRSVLELGRGRLAIGGAGLAGTYLLPKALSIFKTIYPKLDIYMNYGPATSIEQLLQEDTIEIGMFSRDSRVHGLLAVSYAASEMIIAAPPRHPLARKRRVSLEELAAEPFVMREPDSSGTDLVRHFFKERGFDIKLAMEVSSHESIKVAVAEGLGITALGRRWIDNEVALGQIAILKAPDFKLAIDHRVVQREGRPLSQAAKIFRQFLHDRRREFGRLVA
jgi:LysR family transcriptional regulator, low CO2-responsive transcriptional regulator